MIGYLGIDPGQTGAAVLVAEDGETVLGLQRWSDAKTPPMVLPELILNARVVALEGQHVAGPHASLVLAEWSGRLLATLPSGLPVLRPLATSWRAKVFRCGRLQREPAKRLAVRAASPFLLAFNPELRVTHDLAEAWALARYAAFCPPPEKP
jgi:hypothetical protein